MPGTPLIKINHCKHEVVMKDLCASCGLDLRKVIETNFVKKINNDKAMFNANVQAVHNLPELRISEMEAERVAQELFLKINFCVTVRKSLLWFAPIKQIKTISKI